MLGHCGTLFFAPEEQNGNDFSQRKQRKLFKMLEKYKTLIVIPLFNHASTLNQVVQSALATGFPVLVVDDGSTDGGLLHIKGLQCQTLQFPANQGKGVAILAGAKEAKRQGFDAIITLDADGQHDPAEACLLCDEAEKGTWPAIIIGARKMIQDTVSIASHFGRAFSNFWVHLECGQDLRDTQSGMRLYPVKELLSLKLSCKRYDFEVEAIVKAVWAGVTVRSVDVFVDYPPGDKRISHFHKIKDNLSLTKLHTLLVIRRLLPWPHQRIAACKNTGKERIITGNPWQALKKICQEHASPFWLAAAVWTGLFMGALPLIACHTMAIIYVTHRLHLNKIAAVAASQFCAPPVVPVICIESGYFLRTGRLLLDFSSEMWLFEIHHRLWDWFIGSLVVGPVLGIIGGAIMYWGTNRVKISRNARQITET